MVRGVKSKSAVNTILSAPIESMQLLREFGIRPAEEVEMERLTEAGKTLKILEIDLHEASNAEKEEEEEEKERHQSTGSNMM
uniref:Ribosomal_L11 domain-containing protein n=1 Tax=Globodera pallida TaxID=36090 RepID=A0A183BJJ1_GLOPA